MSGTADFTKMVPGFDFLQGLMKNAGASVPNMAQWIAPTLDPEELAKRIEQLRTVQFWLEQNARMLGATVQALEVQRMTLATLKTMNMPMADMRKAMEIRPPAPAPSYSRAAPAAQPAGSPPTAAAQAEGTAGIVDPVQWWGALTQQFTELAANAMRDSTQSFDAAGQALKTAAPAATAPAAASGAAKRPAAPKRSGA